MKYDADIHPDSDNTSHGIVVDLVGRDKEVLDIGCSTGYLAKALAERGCTVTGVEIDPDAADQARSHLKEVKVVDLDEVELGTLTFSSDFDVIVFADVLEHLKDPARALRSAASLLRPGGYVVISIPNIAHGSVRLSLLEGRFDYRAVGLLDNTHIRFFTRHSLGDLLSSSGFAATDMRRTTAGVFATEIPVDATRVPPDAIGELDVDDDAVTYQFVLAAVPVRGDAEEQMATALRRTQDQLVGLRRQLAEIIRAADLGRAAPTIGILTTSGLPGDVLRGSVLETELRRRLDGFRLRPLTAAELEPLAAPGGTAGALGFDLDAVVLTGDLEPPAAKLVDRLPPAGIPVVVFGAVDASPTRPGTGTDADGLTRWPPVPELAVVGDRLFDPELLVQRARYLRLLEMLPVDGGVLLAAVASGGSGAVLRNLAAVAGSQGLALVRLDPTDQPATGSSTWCVASSDPLDLATAVHVAEVVVSDDPVVVALGLALGRPTVALSVTPSGPCADLAAWLGEADLVVPRVSAIEAVLPIARARAAGGEARLQLQAELSEPFDRLASELTQSAGRRAPATVAGRLRDLQDQVNVIQLVNAGLGRRQRAERIAFGARAADLMSREAVASTVHDPGELSRLRVEADALREANARLSDEAGRAATELAALLATRTFRAVRPAREIYRRLRMLSR